jgi:hypothetical protein
MAVTVQSYVESDDSTKINSHLSFSSTSGGQLIICAGLISIFEVAKALLPLMVFCDG